MARAGTTERLMGDLRAVLEDAEALLSATAGEAGDRIQKARERASETISAARERLVDAQEEVAKRAQDAARDADRYVRENPWKAVGIAAGIAFILGVLVSSRR
ncbi:MAG TPA: DUF883 family protein [Steroidobacteraceae bacterium]|jgi:ElaB/YqjD/DUF883 family membrane-anchored ribosome-binding protein|nr:DUF883 family protein [Steroidobacteraceae bacterium]